MDGFYPSTRAAVDPIIGGSSVGASHYEVPQQAVAHFPLVVAPWSIEVVFSSPDILSDRVDSVVGWEGETNGHRTDSHVYFASLYGRFQVGSIDDDRTVGNFLDYEQFDIGYLDIPDTGPQHVLVTWSGSVFEFWHNGQRRASISGSRPHSFTSITVGPNGVVPATNAKVSVAETAVYSRVLSDAEIGTHAAAARNPWAGDSTGQRITRLLAQVGIPASMATVETGGTTSLGGQIESLDGVPTIDAVRDAEAAEFGRFFVAHNGRPTFLDRYHDSRETPRWGFSGIPGNGLRFSSLVEDFREPEFTRAVVTRQGGLPQSWPAAESPGDYTESRSAVYATDAEALGAAQYLVGLYGTPALRVRSVAIHASSQEYLAAAVGDIDLGDKIFLEHQPPGGGAVNQVEVVVEGIHHQIDAASKLWTATYDLSNVGTGTFLALDDATNGLDDASIALAF